MAEVSIRILIMGYIYLITNIINDNQQINNIIKKINCVYKDVKKNEISPQTDYLFTGTTKSNLEKTVEKLEKMDKLIK